VRIVQWTYDLRTKLQKKGEERGRTLSIKEQIGNPLDEERRRRREKPSTCRGRDNVDIENTMKGGREIHSKKTREGDKKMGGPRSNKKRVLASTKFVGTTTKTA